MLPLEICTKTIGDGMHMIQLKVVIAGEIKISTTCVTAPEAILELESYGMPFQELKKENLSKSFRWSIKA